MCVCARARVHVYVGEAAHCGSAADFEFKYVGTFSNGTRHGTGTGSWKNGDTYEGKWYNNVIQGNGTYKWRDKRTVAEGQFVRGVLQVRS